MKRKLPVVKNQKLEATIVDLTYQGMGVAKVEGYSLFVMMLCLVKSKTPCVKGRQKFWLC